MPQSHLKLHSRPPTVASPCTISSASQEYFPVHIPPVTHSSPYPGNNPFLLPTATPSSLYPNPQCQHAFPEYSQATQTRETFNPTADLHLSSPSCPCSMPTSAADDWWLLPLPSFLISSSAYSSPTFLPTYSVTPVPICSRHSLRIHSPSLPKKRIDQQSRQTSFRSTIVLLSSKSNILIPTLAI